MGQPDERLDAAARRIMDGTTWEEFCDTLKAAGSVVLGEGSPEDPFDRAEGFRYLSRLLRSALESFVENADPLAPELRRTAHETIKMGADRAAVYSFAWVPWVRGHQKKLLEDKLPDRETKIELFAIAWIRNKYMDTPFLSAVFQVVFGGILVLATGILIGSS